MITVEFDLLGVEDGDRVLDAGCGEGRHSWEVCKRNRASVVGLDIDGNSIKKNQYVLDALQEQKESDSEYHLILADVTRLPFKDGSFNRVICSEVLEHVPDDQKAVAELVRVLDKSGTIGVSVPHYFAESICWMLSRQYYGFPGGHIRKYKNQQLIDLLQANGLHIYLTRRKHALQSIYWILRCMFGVKKENALVPSLYHKFLVWDLNNNQRFFGWLENLCNHFFPKSIVMYAGKEQRTSSQ